MPTLIEHEGRTYTFMTLSEIAEAGDSYREYIAVPELTRRELASKAVSGSVGLTVRQLVDWRGGCRYGIAGVKMRHAPTGRVFIAAGTGFNDEGEGEVLVYAAERDETGLYCGRETMTPEDCLILSPWPVVCCRPIGRRPGTAKDRNR